MHVLDYDRIPALSEDKGKEDRFAINVIVETPRGTHYKYALEKRYGLMTLRAILPKGLQWPCDFGFIPQTRGGDGDPLDVALLFEEPVFPGCLVPARLIGGFGLRKEGERNDRLVACSLPMSGVEMWTDEVRDLQALPEAVRTGLEAFFKSYPQEQGHRVELTGQLSPDDALRVVHEGQTRWKRSARPPTAHA
jgi:inorganic pyrophosphatase